MITKTLSELEEGMFKADRNSINITADTKDELQKKIEMYQGKYDGFNPKFSSVKTDRNGRFVIELSFDVKKDGEKETLAGKLSRGITKGKAVINKGKEVVGKVMDQMPKSTFLTAPTGFKLGQEQAKFVKEHPDAKFGNKYKNDKGEWTVEVRSAKGNAKSYNKPKAPTSQDRINNIQKTLMKLSDDQLKKIEDIIK